MMSFPARTEVLTLVSAVAVQEGVKTGMLSFLSCCWETAKPGRQRMVNISC